MRLRSAIALIVVAASLTVAMSGCALKPEPAEKPKPTLTVGSKDYVESEILGYLIAERLATAGFTVETRIPVGGTEEVRAALLDGTIDIYAEYTGNALTILREGRPSEVDTSVLTDAKLTYREASLVDRRDFGVVWLTPAPGNNTFVIAIPRALADKTRIRTIGQFAKYVNDGGRVKLAGGAAALVRPDSLARFEAVYGFKLRPDQLQLFTGTESLIGEQAAGSGAGGVNAALGYSTDAGIASNGLIALVDDRSSQGVYQPAPTLLVKTHQRYPEIAWALAPVFAKLTTQTLLALNTRVVVGQEDPSVVARGWLSANGLAR